MSDEIDNKLERAKISEDPGPEPVSTLVAVDEWQDVCSKAKDDEILCLQIGSDWCERCPAMHTCIKALKTDFQFTWLYSDAADTELTEHFKISKLPAVVLYRKEGGPWVKQAANPTEVQQAVRLACSRVFVTDADF